MKYLVAIDMEGVNYVVGEPYQSILPGLKDYDVAVKEGAKELNVIIQALYDCGAEQVYVWDNHSHGHNLDFAHDVDPRAIDVGLDRCSIERMNFADKLGIDGVIFLGYHSKEGTLNGVLAHTYSSVGIQYFKLNGKAVGEFFLDSAIATSKNIPVLMLVSDDKGAMEGKEVSNELVTVTTKYGTGRNSAVFRDNDELMKDLYDSTVAAVKAGGIKNKLTFPLKLEIRYTRTERAQEVKNAVLAKYGMKCEYGEDAHILEITAEKIEDVKMFL